MLLRSENKRKKKLEYAGWTVFFALCLFRFSYYGFRYFPQLDDYIQYHNYAYGKTFAGLWDEVQRLGLFGARPLAGLSDLYIWSAFWECPYAAVLILTLMFALSALLLEQVFSRYFRTGGLFYVLYLLFPLNMEGTYWMSASTRICAGLFFAALSSVLLVRFLERPRILTGAFQLVTQLAACCFYEQILVLSCALLLLLWFLERKRGKRVWLAPASVGFSAFSYLVCVQIFADSPLYSGRGGLVLPISRWYFAEFLPEVCSQLYQVWVRGSLHVLKNGVRRGTTLLVQDGAWWYIVPSVLLCAAAGGYTIWKSRATADEEEADRARTAGAPGEDAEHAAEGKIRAPGGLVAGLPFRKKKTNGENDRAFREASEQGGSDVSVFRNGGEAVGRSGQEAASLRASRGENRAETAGCEPLREEAGSSAGVKRCGYSLQIACGLLLALAPLAVFFAVSNTWYSFRNIVPCLPGLALAADGALQWLLHRAKKSVKIAGYSLVTLCLTVPFLIVSVSELHDYRQTWEDDQAVLEALNAYFDGSMPEERIAVLNLEPSYLTEINYSWHEHIHGVTESRWALCGALTAEYLVPTPQIYPIPLRETLYRDWNYDDLHISGFARVLWYNPEENALAEAEVRDCGDGIFEVRCRGELMLVIREDGRSAAAAFPE